MTFKPNLSRLARLQAGSRPSLPGQDPVREEELRIELTEELQPRGRFEQIWIEDIAYRMAAIEVIRAQIAGCRARLVETVLEDIARRADAYDEQCAKASDDCAFHPDVSAAERAVLERWGRYGMTPMPLTNRLDDPRFAWLLGKVGPRELHLLRLFQTHEHEEVRERDRIINQFERRRRQAVWDAVELTEARRRAGLPEEAEVLTLEAHTAAGEAAELVPDAEFALIEDADPEEPK